MIFYGPCTVEGPNHEVGEWGRGSASLRPFTSDNIADWPWLPTELV